MKQIQTRPARILPASAIAWLAPLFLTLTLGARASMEGSISGRVIDPSGAVMPGVTVTLSNLETNHRQATVTNPEGFYS
ncbi:MAG TPA: carboxypeptidase-like regulatory domain-containing protein, partial [Terriglobia bacterium]|nr:carboxypeptidase-like regulatory domain-containing protein [Terriglobia bacterium]